MTEDPPGIVAALRGGLEAGGDPVPQPDQGDLLPPDCPLKPLGMTGRRVVLLDALNQIHVMPARELGRLDLMGLLAHCANRAPDWWPRHDKEGNPIPGEWRPEVAQKQIIKACGWAGVVDPAEMVCGRGAWEGPDGGLVLHCGDKLFRASNAPDAPDAPGAYMAPGRHGDHVYPAGARLPRSSGRAEPGGAGGAGHEILRDLETWNWGRPERDARLMLGWIGAGLLGGALPWRPLAWVTGDPATGKSTLLERYIPGLLGGALVRAADATEAGIRQTLRQDALPVALDELEAEAEGRRQRGMIELARVAASGGRALRGGADHAAAAFQPRGRFLFASILAPPLKGQDRSRIAVLELGKLGGGAAPDTGRDRLRGLGARLLARLAGEWARLPERVEPYRAALSDVGRDGRGCDLFATLMGVADLLPHDVPIDHDELAGFVARIAEDAAAARHNAADHEECLAWPRSSLLDGAWRDGRRRTAGNLLAGLNKWLDEQAGGGVGPRARDNLLREHDDSAMLQTYGLRLMCGGSFAGGKGLRAAGASRRRGDYAGPAGETRWLAVRLSHATLGRLFEGKRWAGGVWGQALGRAPGAWSRSTRRKWTAPTSGWCWCRWRRCCRPGRRMRIRRRNPPPNGPILGGARPCSGMCRDRFG